MKREVTRRDFFRLGVGGLSVGMLALLAEKKNEASAQVTRRSHRWIIDDETFEKSVGVDLDLAERMKGLWCYVPGEGPHYGTRRIRSSNVRDWHDIEGLIESGVLGAGGNIVYAIENGDDTDPSKQTPIDQQMNLEDSIRSATALCHSVGATLIAAPAGNILQNIDPEHEVRLESMLENHIPAVCARNADAYDIQAQQMEQNVDRYSAYVKACSEQARSAAPDTPVLAGLTTNSPKSRPDDYPTAKEIYETARSVRDVIDGYWLNVPPHRETGVRNYEKAWRFLRLFYGLRATI